MHRFCMWLVPHHSEAHIHRCDMGVTGCYIAVQSHRCDMDIMGSRVSYFVLLLNTVYHYLRFYYYNLLVLLLNTFCYYLQMHTATHGTPHPSPMQGNIYQDMHRKNIAPQKNHVKIHHAETL